MEERLKNLKKSMQKNIFPDIAFTEEHQRQIKTKLTMSSVKSDEEILLSVLQLLIQEKTGFELNRLIRARGIVRFENNEGEFYMFLHQLEQKGYLQSYWKDDEAKYYLLNNKGKRLLKSAEEFKTSTTLNELLER